MRWSRHWTRCYQLDQLYWSVDLSRCSQTKVDAVQMFACLYMKEWGRMYPWSSGAHVCTWNRIGILLTRQLLDVIKNYRIRTSSSYISCPYFRLWQDTARHGTALHCIARWTSARACGTGTLLFLLLDAYGTHTIGISIHNYYKSLILKRKKKWFFLQIMIVS